MRAPLCVPTYTSYSHLQIFVMALLKTSPFPMTDSMFYYWLHVFFRAQALDEALRRL